MLFRSISFLVLGFLLTASAVSCNKNGCSNKNKIESTYNVTDSTMSPPAIDDWYPNSYQLRIQTCSKNDSYLELINLGNNTFAVIGEISGSSFEIPEQDINENYMNFDGSGTIEEDSIFFEFSYLNWFGEPISTVGAGSLQ